MRFVCVDVEQPNGWSLIIVRVHDWHWCLHLLL